MVSTRWFLVGKHEEKRIGLRLLFSNLCEEYRHKAKRYVTICSFCVMT